MYSFPNLGPVSCSISGFNCCFLICIQVSQEAGKIVLYSIFVRISQFVVIHTIVGFNIVNEAEVNVLLGFSCFSYDPTDVGNMISGFSAFSKSSWNVWEFWVLVLFKSSLEDFEYYFACMWNECNCVVVWTFFGIALLWDWNENWPFPVLWPLMIFPNLLACWVQHLNSIMF